MQKHPEPVHFQRHKGLPKVTPQTLSLGTTPRAAEGGEEELGPWGRAGVWDMLWMEMDERGVTSSLWALGSHSSTSPQGWAGHRAPAAAAGALGSGGRKKEHPQ